MNICNFEKAAMLQNHRKPKNNLLLKKRCNQRENEVSQPTSVTDSIFIPFAYGDRFIPRRYSLSMCERNLKFAPKNATEDILNLHFKANYWRQNSFISTFNTYFGLKEHRVLKLSDSYVKNSSFIPKSLYLSSGTRERNINGYDWQCKPRLKPSAFTDATHDVPGFDSFYDQNLVDWSVNGQIVAAFGQDVVIWKRTDEETMLFHIKCVRSLAYCPNGVYLAIGCKSCEYPVLELWDVERSNHFVVANGKVFCKKYCNIQCIEWSKRGTEIVCGTHFGVIYVLSVPDLRVIKKIHKHMLPVTILRFSPTMRFLASGDIEGNIAIYNWKSCDIYLGVRSRNKLNVVFDWHPWNGVDLVISEDVPASIVILHVPNREIVAYYQRMDTKIIINSVTFSKVTGELLVSVSKNNDNGCIDFEVLVMSSLNCVVDLLKIPECGARFMIWSPDGMRLATTGNDETLTIWDFYHDNKKQITNKIEKNEFGWGSQFKMWSCVK